jgi:hypothetical protein
MNIKSNAKPDRRAGKNPRAGGDNQPTTGVKVQSRVKAGFNPQPDPPGDAHRANHNQAVARGLKVRTSVKAGCGDGSV